MSKSTPENPDETQTSSSPAAVRLGRAPLRARARAHVSGSTSGGTWRKSGPKTSYRRRLSGSERTS